MAFVQSTGQYFGGSAGSCALAYGSNVAAGDVLTVMMMGTVLLSGVSDTRGNTWTQRVNDGTFGTSIWTCVANGAGANTVTCTYASTSSNQLLFLREDSGVDTTTPYIAGSYKVGSGTGTNLTTPSFTTSQTATICEMSFNNSAVIITSPFTQRGTNVSGSAIADQNEVAAGTYSGAMTLNASATWTLIMFSLAKSAVVPPASPPLYPLTPRAAMPPSPTLLLSSPVSGGRIA